MIGTPTTQNIQIYTFQLLCFIFEIHFIFISFDKYCVHSYLRTHTDAATN